MLINNYSRLSIPQTWYLGWGRIATVTGATWYSEHIALFVDSTNSVSPLVFSPSERFVIIGEVWLSNHQSLSQLQDYDPSLPFSDLQWVALAWEHWFAETFTKLMGIFSLAVWDREEQTLWLGRDPTGARSLYYTTSDTTRWIAPNLRSLNPYHAQELDMVALRDYLCCAFVPGTHTLWEGVREIRPGTIVSFPDEKIQSYWQLQEGNSSKKGGYPQQLRNLLEQIVTEYLPPEREPVGVFLSGGLDSSCITALAAKLHPAPVHTFSIHFGENCPNELEFSSLVAQHCNTNHHILEITFRQMWDKLPETMGWLDDPIGDPLTVPNLLIGRLAKESVEVVLNGEGGDPCFGGPKNQPMLLNQLYGTATQQDSLQAYLLAFKKCASDLPYLLKPEIWEAVRHQPYFFSEELNSTASYLNRLMALNIKFKGADHILTKVNNLTRGAGIQGRSPRGLNWSFSTGHRVP